MKATWGSPRNHLARIAAVTALVVVTLLAAIVVIDTRASDATAATGDALPGGPYVSAQECPEATAQFVELGLEPPDTFTPDCPNPERLGRDLAKAVSAWPHPPAA